MGLALPAAYPQVLPVTFQGSGSSSFDGWANLTSANFFGYGGFPGNSPWPAPIGSNVAGSGDADLLRLAGSPVGGGPVPMSESIYFGSFVHPTNTLGGTLSVREISPISGLRTIVFQIQIGEASGYDFLSPTGVPSVKLNGSSSGLPATYTNRVALFTNGTAVNQATGQEEPLLVNTWAYQWNLTNGTPVTSFQIEFSAVTHAQVYALRLDQASVLQNYRVLVETPPATNSAPPPLQLASAGAPTFNGSQTTLVHTFRSDTNRTIQFEYTTNPTSTNWQVVPAVATGNGNFSVTLTNNGDVRAAWSQRMFFRARNTP